MELTNMTNNELQSIVGDANKILYERAINERKNYANAIIEDIRKFRDSGGSIYIDGTAYYLDGWEHNVSISSTIDIQSIFEVNEYGDLVIKELDFEREE